MTETRTAVFTPAGSVDGIPLVQHTCERFSAPCAYVSAEPSPSGDAYLVPGCGCRPVSEENKKEQEQHE
jgi:hypothetical protein